MEPGELIDCVQALDRLADLPRTGWLLRGVRPAESIAEHTLGVAIVAMLLCDQLRGEGAEIDGEAVLAMALLHDAPEAATGDIPMPAKTPGLRDALGELESTLAADILPPQLLARWRRLEEEDGIEARIVAAADKIQMMIKVLTYEQRGRRGLDEFWVNPGNFRDMGIPAARAIFEAICARTGRVPPG